MSNILAQVLNYKRNKELFDSDERIEIKKQLRAQLDKTVDPITTAINKINEL